VEDSAKAESDAVDERRDPGALIVSRRFLHYSQQDHQGSPILVQYYGPRKILATFFSQKRAQCRAAAWAGSRSPLIPWGAGQWIANHYFFRFSPSRWIDDKFGRPPRPGPMGGYARGAHGGVSCLVPRLSGVWRSSPRHNNRRPCGLSASRSSIPIHLRFPAIGVLAGTGPWLKAREVFTDNLSAGPPGCLRSSSAVYIVVAQFFALMRRFRPGRTPWGWPRVLGCPSPLSS